VSVRQSTSQQSALLHLALLGTASFCALLLPLIQLHLARWMLFVPLAIALIVSGTRFPLRGKNSCITLVVQLLPVSTALTIAAALSGFTWAVGPLAVCGLLLLVTQSGAIILAHQQFSLTAFLWILVLYIQMFFVAAVL
jgi:hypothetical protein